MNLNIINRCKVCGCTENDACYHPDYGTCWWVDENEDLCSHCADASHENGLAAMMAADIYQEE